MAALDVSDALRDSGRLAALRRYGLLDTPSEEVFDRLTRLASRFLRAPVALVSLVGADRQFFKSCIGLPEPWSSSRETGLSHSFCQHAVASREPLVIEDARAHPLLSANLAIRDLGVVAYLGIPLITSDGHALGTFCIIDHEPRAWTADEISTLADLAASVMAEIELRAATKEAKRQTVRARRAQEVLERRERQHRVLLEAGPVLASSLDYGEALDRVVRLAVPAIADWCAVKMFDRSGAVTHVAAAHPDPSKEQALAEFLRGYSDGSRPRHPGLAVLEEGVPRLLEHDRLAQLAGGDDEAALLRDLGAASAIVAPLAARGRTLGILVVVRGDPSNRYGSDDVDVAQLLAQRAALAIDNARLFSELDEERDRLRRLLERFHAGVVTVDAALRVHFVNDAASRIPGLERLSPGHQLPDPWNEVSLPGIAARLFASDAVEIQTEVSPAPGATYWLVGLPAHTADDAVLVFTDLSARERRERAEREFVTNAAHELHTPLTGITSAIEVLQSGAKEVPEDRDAFLGDIEREAARLRRLARGLLLLAEVQAQEKPVRVEDVQMKALLEDVAAGLQPKGTVSLEVECASALTARTNPELVEQIVSALASNAIKYTSGGSIRLGAKAADGGTLFEVTDTGAGMPADAGERLFDRFYRGGTRDRDGFGLGLSIAEQAVRALGGSIDVASAPGRGTTVTVFLPDS